MAEAFSLNFSSDDLIVKSIQQTIDSQMGLVPEGRDNDQRLHEVSLLSSLDQSDSIHLEQGKELVQNGESQITNSTNSSHIDANDALKEEQTVGFVGVLKRNEKKEKRPRKRGKELKKGAGLIDDFERLSVCDCDKRENRARVVYSLNEMEGLKDVRLDEQKKKWIEVYCGLGSVVAKEYDGLSVPGHDGVEENCVNFDPRRQFASKKGAVSDFNGNEPDNIGNGLQNINQVDHVFGVKDGDLDGSVGGEEDYYEEEDSDSEYVSIQRPAFVVTGEPDFDSGPPQDGLEYLRRVRWEAEHIPKVKVAKVKSSVVNKEQTVYMPKIPDIAACPEQFKPSKEWEDVFLADFSCLRLGLSENASSVSNFPDKNESTPLVQSIIGNVIQENHDFTPTDDGSSVIQDNLDSCLTNDKTTICDWANLQTILQMQPVARVTMLRKRIASLETMSTLCRDDCAWLFALCAAIDTPLDADTSASLRSLLRKCATLRAEKPCLDDEVIMLNILATISGKYFGQLETVKCL